MSSCPRILQVYIVLLLNIIFISFIPSLSFSVAMVALSSLISVSSLRRSSPILSTYQPDLQRIDEVMDIVELLCGEATFQGFDLVQQDYLDQEERLVGGGFMLPHQ